MKTASRILLNLAGALFLATPLHAGSVQPSGNIITDTTCSGDISSDCSTVSSASGNAFTSTAFGATLNLGTSKLTSASFTVATLPATRTKGQIVTVTDAVSLAVGACVGTGTNATLAICVTTNTWNCL